MVRLEKLRDMRLRFKLLAVYLGLSILLFACGGMGALVLIKRRGTQRWRDRVTIHHSAPRKWIADRTSIMGIVSRGRQTIAGGRSRVAPRNSVKQLPVESAWPGPLHGWQQGGPSGRLGARISADRGVNRSIANHAK